MWKHLLAFIQNRTFTIDQCGNFPESIRGESIVFLMQLCMQK